jgi:NDMA-dependent alcohol dehydrogenase
MRSRAAILYEYGRPWSVEEFELDPPRAGEVLLQLAATGLCHSDEHIRQGKLAPPPETLRSLGLPAMSPTIGGHEGSGVVLEVGEGVTRFAPGDHVVTSFVAVCGQCRWCASGMEYLCDTGSGTLAPGMPTDGTFRHHTVDGRNLGHISKIGAFAEHTVVSADSLVKIDQGFPLVPAALLACAVPTGYGSAARRANVRGGDTVVVIGAGGIGTAAIQGSRISGAARIVAVDPVDFKRESALKFGATHTASTAAEATEMVRELTRGVMADAVVVSPAMIGEADVGTALELTRKGGTCVLTGLPSPRLNSIAVALQDFILMNKTLRGTVFGSCNPKSDIPLLAALYESGQLLLDEMITKRYRLDEINEAYADKASGELIRGVIDFGVTTSWQHYTGDGE